MKFNSQFVLVGLNTQALDKYLNQDELVLNKVLAFLFIAIVVGFFVKGK